MATKLIPQPGPIEEDITVSSPITIDLSRVRVFDLTVTSGSVTVDGVDYNDSAVPGIATPIVKSKRAYKEITLSGSGDINIKAITQ